MKLRPFRSSGFEVIGWDQYFKLLPRTSGQGLWHLVRIGPCWVTWARMDRTPDPGNYPTLPPPPQTPWTRAVDVHLDDIGMTPDWKRHSVRTWRFASALAEKARKPLAHPEHLRAESEVLYIAAMLHDSGLFEKKRKSCFAVDGSANAKITADMADVHDDRVDLITMGIKSHISVKPDNELALYLQYGSILDLTGMRMWKLDRHLVDRILTDDERNGLPTDGRTRWSTECTRFPHGRAAYARWPGLFVQATKWAPLPG